MIFAHDQPITRGIDDDLLRSVYKSNKLCEQLNVKIFASKTKLWFFKERELVTSKLVVNRQNTN